MAVWQLAPQIALAVGAVLVLVVASFLPRRHQSACAALSLAVVAVAVWQVAKLQHGTPATLGFAQTWALDDLTAWASYAILGTGALVITMSPRWFATDRRHGEWYTIVLFATLGATLLAGAADLMELLVAALLASVTGSTLASYHRESRMSAEAGAKFYFLGALANPLLFLGVVFLYAVAGTTGYPGIRAALGAPGVDPLAVSLGVALVLIGLAFELGAFPVHPWLPDVSQGSPAPAAAFLTVAPKLGALVAVARFVQLVPDELLAWRPALAGIAAITMSLGNLAALWQSDVRRLLGWSSVSQAGYGLMAVVALNRSGLALSSLVLFVVGYALANLAAFAVVVALRGRTSIEDYRGLAARRPWLALALTVALLSLVGIPPLVGFAAKLALFGAAIEAGYAWLAVLAVVNTVVSLFYYLRVIGPMYLAKPQGKVALLGWQASGAALLATLLVLAVGIGAEVVAGPTAVLLPR